MNKTLKPRDHAETLALLAWAAAERKSIEVVGGASKQCVGRPLQTDHVLDLSELTGITMYEPEELVLTAKAGTTVREIETALAEHGQELAFEPPGLGRWLGGTNARATIGAAFATNLSGPRRIHAGAARDHFLGLEAVTGRGEAIKSGGRVVKNVTGYDLCKGLAGSWGTLAVFTSVTFKVLPRAETTQSLLIFGLKPEQAMTAMSDALGSAHSVSGAAHLTANVAAQSTVDPVSSAGRSVTVLRLEGFESSVAARFAGLQSMLGESGEIGTVSGRLSQKLWREIRDLKVLSVDDDCVVWRISTTPMKGADIARNISLSGESKVLFDWGGGLVWLVVPKYGDASALGIRSLLERAGGHATLFSNAPPELRASIDVFQPQAEALAALTRRMKLAFDPHAILNPGRMYAGV
ncbi:MAG: glycolate oxidase subunit GlcE [Hyphomicrobiales bacterium]